MGFRPLTDEELAQSGLTNETPPVQEEAGTFKPLSPKQVEALKLLTPGSPAYELSEKYKEAWGLDADSIGKRIQVKDETGLPDFVLDRRPETEKKAQAGLALKNAPKIDWEEVERDYPVTGNFLGAHMPVAYDDIDNLKKQESLWGSLSRGFREGVAQTEVNELRFKQFFYGDKSEETETTIGAKKVGLAGLNNYDSRLKSQTPVPSGFGSLLNETGKLLGQQVPQMEEFFTGSILGVTMASLMLTASDGPAPLGDIAAGGLWAKYLSQYAGKAGGAAFGGVLGRVDAALKMSGGELYDTYLQVPGMDPDAARLATALTILPHAASEFVQFSALKAPFTALASKLGLSGSLAARELAMKELLQRPTVLKAFKGLAKNYAGVYIPNVLQEGLQRGISEGGTSLAAGITNLISALKGEADPRPYYAEQFNNPDAVKPDNFPEHYVQNPYESIQIQNLVAAVAEEIAGAAKSFSLLPIPGAVGNFTVDIARAERATRNAQLFRALGDTATASKVRNRLPKAFREFVDRATREGGWEKVYISAGAFDGVFGQDAPKVAEDLCVKDEYEQAKATGGEIAIDTATYAEKLAPTQAHQNLVGDLRLKEGEMTPNEAQEFLANVQAERDDAVREAQEAIAKDDEWGREVESVRQEVRDQLVLNGRVAEEADADALVYASWINSLACKVKKTPLELHSSIGLRVQEGSEQGGQPRDGNTRKPPSEFIVKTEDAGEIQARVIHRDDGSIGILVTSDKGATMMDYNADFANGKSDKDIVAYALEGFGIPEIVEPNEGGSAEGLVLNQFIGKTGIAELNMDVWMAQADAKIMAGEGKSPEEIKEKTGFHQGSDGKWRYEISDADAKLVGAEDGMSTREWLTGLRGKLGKEILTLEDVLDHPNLFRAYPGLRQVEVDFDALHENANISAGGITLGEVLSTKSAMNSLMHEIQHAIQVREGHASGGTSGVRAWTDPRLRKALMDELAKNSAPQPAPYSLFWGSDEHTKESDKAYADYLKYFKKEMGSKISSRALQEAAGHKVYEKLAGEIEARDASARLNLTDEARRRVMPNVPEDAIVVYNGQEWGLFKQGKRGQIALSSGKNVMSLFKSADASTFIHEMGHLMLQTLEQFATLADADPQLLKDWQATREFLNLQEGETLASLTEERLTEAHEKFARTFEAYLMTGEAPTVGLKRVFRQFREWLVNIYKEVRALDTGVTPEIKAVFDRMLGADDEIAEAEALARYNRDVQATEGVELTEEEVKQYESLKEEAEAQARETLTARLMKPLERLFGKDKKAEYEKKRREYENEAREDLKKLPAYRILALLGESKKKGGLKFDRGSALDIIAGLGGPQEEQNKQWFAKKGGMDPEAVAIEYGYTSASEMFLDLLTAPDLEVAVRQEAQARLDAEFDPKVDPETVREAAERAVRSGHRLELLAIERLILAKSGGKAIRLAQAKARVQAARVAARKALEGKLWKDAGAWQRYVQAERRAAKAVERAILKGDMDEALRQKDVQILQAALATEALKAKRESARMVKFLKKFADRGRKETFGVDPRHLEQIDALLENYEFKRVSEDSLERRESLIEYIATEQELGLPISVPESLLADMRKRNYAKLTFSELEDLHNLIRAISKAGQELRALEKEGQKQKINEAQETLKKALGKHKVTHPGITSSDPNRRLMEKLADIPDSLDAALMKAQTLLMMLDGTKGMDTPGAFIEIFWRPFAEADDVKRVMLTDYAERIDNAIGKYFKPRQWGKFLNKRVFIESLGFSLTGEQMFCVYMNLGTETNKVRLMEGKGWTEAQIAEIVGKLDKRALDLGQDIHDIIETLWPLMVQLDEDLLGYAPKKEEAVPVVTQHGTYRGGYYPLASDFGKGVDIHTLDERAEALYKSQPAYQAMTRQGAHKARAKHADYQVRLDLGVLKKHIEEVVHDLAFRRATVDARRILRDKDVRTAIAQRVGREGLRVLTDWLKDTARPPASATDRISRGARWLRYGTTTAMLCLKFTVLVLQGLGWFNTAQVMGWRTLRAMYMYYLRPHTWVRDWEFVMESSAFMTERNGIVDANVREVLLDREYGKNPALIKEIGAAAFNFADGIVTIPTWLEGYRIGLEKYGGDEEKAVGYADDIVRQTQGGSGSLDLSALQRTTSEWKRAFTMFYQYFNVVYNLLRRSGHRIDGIRNWGQFGGSLMLLVVLPAIAEGLFRDDDTPEEDEWAEWAKWVAMKSLTYGMGSIPVARDLTSYTVARWTGIGYGGNMRLTPLASPIESVIRTGRALFDEDKDWWDKSKQITETGAYLVPYPMQVHTTAWNIIEYLNGDDPDWDWSNLVARKPRSRR